MSAFSFYLDSFAGAELRQFDLLHTEMAISGAAPAKASSSKAPAEPKAEKKKEKAVEEVTAKVAELKVEDAPAPVPAAPAKPAAEEDDDIDLFGSDDDLDEEVEKVKAARVAEYQAKKEAKPQVIAKSQVILDVKPWDDETDMDELTKNVRAIEMDGLLWGVHKLVAVGYGIKKLQITCVVEDAKVSIDELSEKIAEDEDHVQSVDVAAFNKL